MPDLQLFGVRSLLGLALGIALGFAARRGRFCTLGAIEDTVYGHDTRRLRVWILATAIAIAGVHALETFADLDLSRSIYTGLRIEWGGAIIGGLLFGLGMAMVGTCGFGTLLRLGGGDLKALVTFLVMAFIAMMTMRGVTGLARIQLLDPLSFEVTRAASQRLPDLLGFGGATGRILPFSIAAAMGTAACAHAGFLRSVRSVATGVAVALLLCSAGGRPVLPASIRSRHGELNPSVLSRRSARLFFT